MNRDASSSMFWRQPPEATAFAFYEVYKSKDAFAAHMETPHFKRFASVAEEAVSDKQVSEYFRLQGAAKPFQLRSPSLIADPGET